MNRLIVALMLVVAALTGTAKRKITPVEPGRPVPSAQAAAERTPDMKSLAHYHDEKGNIVLVDTVTGTEYADTLATSIPRMRYPLLHNITVGVDIWDAAMRLFGQKYGIGSVSVGVSLHNRYIPTLEVGLSTALDTPAAVNFTFRSPLAPYFKIGADYNFFYNSNPDYALTAGVRYGITRFSYGYTGVSLGDGYWPEPAPMDFTGIHATAGYLEIMLGLRVKIAGPLSMGWMFKYHSLLHESESPYGPAMVVPGFGKRGTPVTGAFSIFYVFGLNRVPPAIVE